MQVWDTIINQTFKSYTVNFQNVLDHKREWKCRGDDDNDDDDDD